MLKVALKKINNLARICLNNLSADKDRLLKEYGSLPAEPYLFKKDPSISLGKSTNLTCFGIEFANLDSEIFIALPIRSAEVKQLTITFDAFATKDQFIFQATPVNENKEVIGKPFSLRTCDTHRFSASFDLDSKMWGLKIKANQAPALVNIGKINFSAFNSLELVKTDIQINQKNHRAVVCFPIIDWEFRKQRPQHLMREFAKAGNHIMYLSTRLYGFHHDQAVAQDLEPYITKIHLPGNYRLNLYKDTLTERSIDQACRAITKYLLERAFEDVVLVCHLPFWYPIAKRLREQRGYPIVYDCMDDHSGFENNTDKMLALEHELCEQADLLVTTSQLLFEQKSPTNKNTILIRNAGDVKHFTKDKVETPSEIKDLKKPIIGYFGAISEWFDLESIKLSAKKHPEWSHVLIGHYEPQTKEQLDEFSNVTLLGEKEYKTLPEYLYSFDVCTIPFKRIPLTEATNPVKIYEYFASGKPVVSRDLPEVQVFSDITYLYDTPESFVSQVEKALLEGTNQEKINKRKEVSANNTWEIRGEALQTAVNRLQGKVAIVIVSYESLDFLRACVESILRNTEYQNYEIVIVDNASSEPVRSYLMTLDSECDKVKLILNDSNRGFSAANNQGIKAAPDAEYYVLLNNDTVVPTGWLNRLVYYAKQKDIGMVGPVTNCIGNEAQIHTTYKDMNEMDRVSWGLRNQFQGEIFDIKVLAMYCVAFRKEVLDKVGLLDEDFGMGMFEDDDYAQRIRQAGYRVVCAEDAFMHHYGSVSFKQLSSKDYQEVFDKNKAIYEKKWGKWIPHTYR